ncbi:MAG: acyl-CoA dehydrogenase family protein [Cyanobacteria bacterium P01_D01_bin.1]
MPSIDITRDRQIPLTELEAYLESQVVPVAQRLDREPGQLFSAFLALGSKGWLAPKLPDTDSSIGGLGLSSSEYQWFQSAIARQSGALAFLQTQHQSAASLLLSGENEVLKQRYLPEMVSGNRRVGVGFSQLRRQPSPLRAEVVAGGYRLNGLVPWVTGAGLFDEFVGAAVLPDGSAVFGLIPLVSRSETSSEIVVSEPMRLAAMSSMNTVTVEMKDWVLPAAQVVGCKPKGWIEGRDHANPLSPLGLIFGCARAGVDVLGQSLNRRIIDHDLAVQLKLRLTELQTSLPSVAALPDSAYDQKLSLRAQAITLMNTCTGAAVIATSGAANSLDHPAQRVYGESMVFSVSGQTTDGAIAALDKIAESILIGSVT